MALLPDDSREFLSLLNAHGVRYLLVGGYEVIHHGYPRSTADMDIWFAVSDGNTDRLLDALRDFGFASLLPERERLLEPQRVLRMGLPPFRIELLNQIDGVELESCYQRPLLAEIDGLALPLIALDDLRRNKRASGRYKDLADLEHLPGD